MTPSCGVALIAARGLSRTYGAADSPVYALREATFSVNAGEFVAITGASGSGKSTLLNLLGLLDRPSTGDLRLDDTPVATLGPDARAKLRGQSIGFVFQSFGLLSRTSALDNVGLPLVYRGIGKRERDRKALEALGRVGLTHRASHTPSQLSGGQQQRVAIARAIVTGPLLLLADEPTGNLDSQMSDEVMTLLCGLVAEGTTLVLVTHDPHVAGYASRVLHCRDGEIVSDEKRAQ